jgi:hypothetical protein
VCSMLPEDAPVCETCRGTCVVEKRVKCAKFYADDNCTNCSGRGYTISVRGCANCYSEYRSECAVSTCKACSGKGVQCDSCPPVNEDCPSCGGAGIYRSHTLVRIEALCETLRDLISSAAEEVRENQATLAKVQAEADHEQSEVVAGMIICANIDADIARARATKASDAATEFQRVEAAQLLMRLVPERDEAYELAMQFRRRSEMLRAQCAHVEEERLRLETKTHMIEVRLAMYERLRLKEQKALYRTWRDSRDRYCAEVILKVTTMWAELADHACLAAVRKARSAVEHPTRAMRGGRITEPQAEATTAMGRLTKHLTSSMAGKAGWGSGGRSSGGRSSGSGSTFQARSGGSPRPTSPSPSRGALVAPDDARGLRALGAAARRLEQSRADVAASDAALSVLEQRVLHYGASCLIKERAFEASAVLSERELRGAQPGVFHLASGGGGTFRTWLIASKVSIPEGRELGVTGISVDLDGLGRGGAGMADEVMGMAYRSVSESPERLVNDVRAVTRAVSIPRGAGRATILLPFERPVVVNSSDATVLGGAPVDPGFVFIGIFIPRSSGIIRVFGESVSLDGLACRSVQATDLSGAHVPLVFGDSAPIPFNPYIAVRLAGLWARMSPIILDAIGTHRRMNAAALSEMSAADSEALGADARPRSDSSSSAEPGTPLPSSVEDSRRSKHSSTGVARGQ